MHPEVGTAKRRLGTYNRGVPRNGSPARLVVALSVAAALAVLYRGTVPDMFAPGRAVVVSGRLRNGMFVAVPGSLLTKCPSKYTPASKS